MCGFIGYILNKGNKKEKEIEEKFNVYFKELERRGPDFSEHKNIKHNNKLIKVGFARLSIQDLSESANKIFYNNEYVLLFNGEIYNHGELKKKYFNNEKFQTETDTEVLFKFLIKFSFNKITELRGIFSIVLLSLKKNKIYCVKDFTGTKPLYYTKNNDGFFFSSEAWFPYSVSEKKLNQDSLKKYFKFGFVYGEETLIQNVNKVPARTIITYDWHNKNFSKNEYFNLNKEKKFNIPSSTETKNLLEKVVKDNLISDAKVGTFLSGGVDSSIISLIAKKSNDLISFTSVYEPKDKYSKFNTDFYFTEKLCKDYDIKLKVSSIQENQNLLNDFYRVVDYFDEPIPNLNFLNIFWQSKEASRSGVKVILTGDGGDEMFCGYERYQKCYIAHKLNFFKFFSKKIDNLNPKNPNNLPIIFYGMFGNENLNNLINFDYPDNNNLNIFNNEMFTNSLDYINFFDTKYWLSDENNYKLDKCTMINSVEARVPFQDLDIINNYFFINNLKKIGLIKDKFILKNTEILPNYIKKRKKKGWIQPENIFLNKNLNNILKENFQEDTIKKQNLFNCSQILKLFNLPIEKKYLFKRELMAIIVFQKWYEKVLSLK